MDDWNTYYPVVSGNTARMMLVMELINDWNMQSINFMLAFLQAPVKTDIYMKPPKVPKDFEIPNLPKFTDRFILICKLIKNLYFLKDASKTWYEYLKNGLLKRGWSQSTINECAFKKGGNNSHIYQ